MTCKIAVDCWREAEDGPTTRKLTLFGLHDVEIVEVLLLGVKLLLVGGIGEVCGVVVGVSVNRFCRMLGAIACQQLSEQFQPRSDLPPHELLNVPVCMSPGAVRFEVVLPRPPLHLTICACDTDEAFLGAFGRRLVVSSRLVVAVTVILRGETDVFRPAFGMAALERLGVFSFVFAKLGQPLRESRHIKRRLTVGLSGSSVGECGRCDMEAVAGLTFSGFHGQQWR